MEKVSCNLCGRDTPALLYNIPDYLLDRQEIVSTLVQCSNCSLIYQNPRPTLAEIGDHYPAEYDSYHPETAENGSPLLRKAVQYGLQKRVSFVTRFRSGGRVLDIGCATGMFLNKIVQEPSWTGMGVEIDEGAARIARERYNLDIFTGTLETAEFADEAFDAVTMWDVFEHLHDPKATLREIYRILKAGGLLVVRIPNYSSWDSKIFADVWAGLDQPRHLYVFDLNTIHQLLTEGNFKVLEQSSKIGSYPTFVLSVRFWMVRRRIAPRQRERVLRWLYHPLARIVSAPLFYIASLRSRGPLVVVVAEKVSHA